MTDGPGLQAFVVVSSRTPLPPFADWTAAAGLRQRWGHVAADHLEGVWGFEDGVVARLSSVPRGDLRHRPDPEELAPFRAVREYLEKLPNVEAVRGIAFPVRLKD